MGMFDTVRIKCPWCDLITEEQTKSGPCHLDTFDLDEADPSLMSGLVDGDGRIWCQHCQEPFKIKAINRPIYRAIRDDGGL